MLTRASEGRWLLPAAFILLGLLLGTGLVVLRFGSWGSDMMRW